MQYAICYPHQSSARGAGGVRRQLPLRMRPLQNSEPVYSIASAHAPPAASVHANPSEFRI